MTRLLLVRHASTAVTGRAGFPATSGVEMADPCEPLDPAGWDVAAELGAHLPVADRVWSSLARRAVETAASWDAVLDPDPDLAECDFGKWAGRTTDDVHAEDPDGLAAWYADPGSAPHGGEGLGAVRTRARRVLDSAAQLGGTTVAVTHGGLVKAALLEVLELPDGAVWRLDAAPASVTELEPSGPVWRVVRLNWTPSLTRPPAVPGRWP